MFNGIRLKGIGWMTLVLLFTVGCASAVENSPKEPQPTLLQWTATVTRGDSLPTPTSLPSPTVTPQPKTLICSPLAGYQPDALAAQISNPYNPPPPGSDDPHYGVDLADFNLPERIARSGMAVQAVLSGRVAGVIVNRFPYGNTLIVESPLSELDDPTVARLNLPDPPLSIVQPLTLTCPPYPLPEDWRTRPRSLYLLYAHLRDAPTLPLDETVTCGQVIGAIGDSGNALAPHLHLEARIGPAGVDFPSMAHYSSSATSEEMAAYCLWRVSGLFQSLDAMCLLNECSSLP